MDDLQAVKVLQAENRLHSHVLNVLNVHKHNHALGAHEKTAYLCTSQQKAIHYQQAREK